MDKADHDVLIEVRGDVKNILATLKRLNGSVAIHETRLQEEEKYTASHIVRIKSLERRPSASKAVYLVGGVLGLIQLAMFLAGK